MTRSNSLASSAGVTAGIFVTLMFAVARLFHLTQFNWELHLGRLLLNHSFGVALTWCLGAAIHLTLSGVVGMLYARAFRAFGKSSWDVGIAFGIVHWLVGGTLLLTQAEFGAFGLRQGGVTFVLYFLAHLLFGATVGGLFELPKRPGVHQISEHKDYKRAA